MKPSHLQTPRGMNESTFWMGGDPIERPEPKPANINRWLTFVVLVLLALTLIGGVK